MSWDKLNYDWNLVRAFLVTAQEGSFSAAARKLNTTQPTLSRQVAALEAALDLTLFERVAQGIQLTETGLELMKYAQAMDDSASQFSLSASGQSQKIEGNVCISVSEIDAVYRLPPVIHYLRQHEPGIELEIVVSNAVSDLKRRDADIAIRSFRPTQPDLIARKLTDEKIWLYGAPGYVAQFTDPNNVAALQIVGFDRSTVVIDAMARLGLTLNQANFAVITKFQQLQWELAKQGTALAIFPEQIGDAEPRFVRAFESYGPIMQIPLWLVCHRELHTSLRVRRVFDILVKMLAD